MLLDKVKDRDIILWYDERNAETGWTVDVLKEQIKNKLYERQALISQSSNFQKKVTAAAE